MSLTGDLRKGMVIRHQGHLFTVADFTVARTGKQRPTVHVKLRSVKDGHPVDRTLAELGELDEVPAETCSMQYLYASGRDRVFMDTESFEQYPLGEDILADAAPFLVEQETYRFLRIDEQIVAIQLPPVVVLEVVETSPVEHAGGATNVQKEARLAGGLTVNVPLFIKNGDRLRIKTENHEYLGKEH